jgi:hypothetical protein
MAVAKIDSPEVESSMIAFTNEEYSWAAPSLPGAVYVDGSPGDGYCNYLTNGISQKSNVFNRSQVGCGMWYYAYCEFKAPRGKIRAICAVF